MNKESIIKAEKAESYYLKLIEEKQLELIWHPDRREECSIVFSSGEAIRAVYSSPEDTPMSCFRELNMFHLLLGDLRKDSWKLYAIKAVKYLRMLPVEIQIKNLEAYHRIISGLYEEMGNEHKAQLHYEQALMYSTGPDFSFESENIMELLDKFQDNPQAQLEICMYILGFITADGVWTGYEYYDFWQREHYELVENILKHDVLQYVEEEEERPIYALIISCLKGIYYKRTRRFILAEKYFMEAIGLYSALYYKECFINPLMLYTLLGQTYIGMNDMKKADSCFKKALDIDGSDTATLKSLILTYYGTSMEEEDFTELDEEYVRTFTEVCQEEIAFSPFVKKAIDDFFTPPEIYDEDEEENYDEEPNDQEYTFDDWYELAENGDVKAQLIVGHCYFTGTAVTQNYRIAREWFFLAALQGDAIAQWNLSFMYEHGYGTEISKEEAGKWRWKSEHEATWKPDLKNFALK